MAKVGAGSTPGQRFSSSYLGGHDTLALLDEPALGALAGAVPAGLLVPAQAGDEPVVAAPRALGHSRPPAAQHAWIKVFIRLKQRFSNFFGY